MRFLQNAVLAALKRVQLFLDDNVAVLAGIVDLSAARKRRSATASANTLAHPSSTRLASTAQPLE
jgi:hypothetical protein